MSNNFAIAGVCLDFPDITVGVIDNIALLQLKICSLGKICKSGENYDRKKMYQ